MNKNIAITLPQGCTLGSKYNQFIATKGGWCKVQDVYTSDDKPAGALIDGVYCPNFKAK